MSPAFLVPIVPLLALAVATAPTRPAPVRPAPVRAVPDAGRPLVLVVHGRGQLARDTAELRRELRGALQDGMRAVAGDSLLDDADVRLVWYADALDAGSRHACVARPAGAAAADTAAPRQAFRLLAVLAGSLLEAIAVDEAADPGVRELRAIAGDLRYLGDPWVRCAAEQRLDSALARAARERRPVVVVAHSFGALVSWGHLSGRAAVRGGTPTPRVERLVTVGSPLASPDVRRMVFDDAATPLALPAGVGSWVNVVDAHDPLAVPLGMAHGGAGATLPAGMRDVATVGARIDSHELGGYLRDPATARAVAEAWCAAQGRRAPAACARR